MTRPNEQMIGFWNEVAGPRWVRLHGDLDAQLELFEAPLYAAAAIGEGARVLEVGSGCGAFAVRIARRVGSTGSVLGVDISEPMLAQARELVRAAGVGNVELARGDAQIHAFEAGAFDAVVSRFGVMFFEDPRAAFVNLGRALRSGGRFAFVCWQRAEENEWATIPLAVVTKLGVVPSPAVVGAPGPFAFADADRVRRLLGESGFAGIEIEDLRPVLPIGLRRDAAGAAEYLLEQGPAGAALREREELRPAAEAALAEVLAARGPLTVHSAAWRVSARKA